MDSREFEAAAREASVIPLSRTFAADTLTPVAIYLACRQAGERGFLFESVTGGRHVARFSLIGIAPRERLTAGPEGVRLHRGGQVETLDQPFPEALKARLSGCRALDRPGLPRFAGGWVGTLGYNCAAMIERLPVRRDPDGGPDADLQRFDDLLIFDHVRNQVIAVANAFPEEHASTGAARADAETRLDRLQELLAAVRSSPLHANGGPTPPIDPTKRAGYEAGVVRAQAEIRAGEIFQVVLSVQERLPFGGDPFAVYRRLRMSNPSPYHFFLDREDEVVLGASPEMLVRVEDRTVEIRPIAGTRPRGATPAEDHALRQQLLADAKEAAEHVMLVDLGRNDVGRVAEFGSVKVESLRQVELYSHVMHLVSSVTGRLRPELHPVDALFACFPAGTVTGAPKIRAMEIIHELEDAPRGVYAGAVGYFDYRGNLDTCIAIRTLVVRGGEAIVQAGAGIVADSDPTREFAECGHKTAALRAALALPPQLQEVAS